MDGYRIRDDMIYQLTQQVEKLEFENLQLKMLRAPYITAVEKDEDGCKILFSDNHLLKITVDVDEFCNNPFPHLHWRE